MMSVTHIVAVLLTLSHVRDVTSTRLSPDPHGHRLHHQLFTVDGYDSRVRPAQNAHGNLTVHLGLSITQLIKIDEKNQIMTASVWLRQDWIDPRLRWDPSDYGGLQVLHIPSEDIWRPDIVLYNNADGDFAITKFTKATVYYDGKVVWQPPAQYKSYCPIDVEFFPFDIQECFMKFGVWTYDGNNVDLQHLCKTDVITEGSKMIIPNGIDLRGFAPNVEWDVVEVIAARSVKTYDCCPAWYPDIMFNMTIRRRTLFHTVNLIIPCIAISGLTVLGFYLPADTGEKVTLSLSILMALAVFFLLLNDIIPPTSLVMPMIGKYLLFTMVVVIMSIFLTVINLSVNYRNPSTHTMSPWVRRVFTEILPKILMMPRPQPKKKRQAQSSSSLDSEENGSTAQVQGNWRNNDNSEAYRRNSVMNYTPDLLEAVKGVKFIADHMEEEDAYMADDREWEFVAKVIDRLFLYIFSTAVLTGSIGIFMHAPSLYDTRVPLVDETGSTTSCIY